MNVAQHIPEDELALFALAELQPEEAALTVAHLRHCALCRSEVAELQGDLVAYALASEMQAPPAESRARLLRAVAQETKFLTPAPAMAEPQLNSQNGPGPLHPPAFFAGTAEPVRGGGVGWLGWAVAACCAALAGWQFYQGQDLRRQVTMEAAALSTQQVPGAGDVQRAREIVRTLTDPTAMQVALRQPGRATPAHPEAHAAYNPESGDLILVASHLKPVGEDRTYELWLLPTSGENPVPAGLFRPDAKGNATVVLPQLPRHLVAKGFGVTVEQDGGSSTPTLPIVLAGT